MRKRVKTLLTTTLRNIDETTTQTVVQTLLAHSDLTVTHPGEYGFTDNTISCYRYQGDGWQPVGRCVPECDVWIVWIDGYALDHAAMGFADAMAFFEATQELFLRNLANGNVGAMYNHPQAERNTLKDFLADLDSEEFHVIPSYRLEGFAHLADIYQTLGPLVVKPFWGGLRQGVVKVTCEEELLALRGADLRHQVAQLFCHGPEKRLWVADGECRQGGVHYGKRTPWSDFAPDYRVLPHDQLPTAEAAADIARAERLAAKVGLHFGSVDFIGDHINEVNGAGTGHVMWNLEGAEVVDARPLLQAQLIRLIGAA